MKEVMRRTGLSRRQLRYLEERAILGFVGRSDERRIFDERQVLMLDLLARFREVGANIDEAAALARERLGGEHCLPDARLDELLDRAIAQSERQARVTLELQEIRRRRLPAA